MTKSIEARHLSWEFLERRLESGVPSIDIIAGKPLAEVLVEDGGGRLLLRIHSEEAKDERLPTFASVECKRVRERSRSYVQLTCLNRPRFQEFYAFLVNVTDRVQLRGARIDAAIEGAAEAVRDLLAGDQVLSKEKQVGLWGELWMLNRIAQDRDWRTAVEAWVANGETPEEHDFALNQSDFEVKTTSLEARRHHIASRAQLLPKNGRDLSLVSIQVTTGGAGGRSLADIVADTRKQIPDGVRSEFEVRLKAHGWKDSDAPKYVARWVQRTEPMLIPIELLPNLQPNGANTERLVSWSYELDVSGLGTSAAGSWKQWMK